MKIVFAVVVVVGIAIGLAIPVAKSPAPVATAAAAAAAPAPVAAPAPAEDVPVDTVLDRSAGGHFLAVADVNGEPVRFVVDTGADTVALTMEDATRAHVAFNQAEFEVVGKGASGDVRGQVVHIDNMVLDGKRATDVTAVVLEGSSISLLGHTYLRRLANVQIQGDKMTLR
ncbi:MAG: TIGR02281 family clan AA aspartic protease [Sphingomonas sp.]